MRVSSFTIPVHGVVANNHDGTFTYTSQSGYVGADSFEVIIEDGRGGFSRSTVHVNISLGDGPNTFTAEYGGFQPLEAGDGPIAFESWRVPRAMDWDGDGLQDLLVGAAGNE